MDSATDAAANDGEKGAIPPADGVATEQASAWEEIETGRFQPRRIRGSCRGRELG
jgi:hypothetical protein